MVSANGYQLQIYRKNTKIESLKWPEYVLPYGYVFHTFHHFKTKHILHRQNLFKRGCKIAKKMAKAAVRSKAVVLLLLVYCLVCFSLVVGVLCLSLFCCALLCVLSSFTIILKRKRELVALLLLSYGCFVIVNVL